MVFKIVNHDNKDTGKAIKITFPQQEEIYSGENFLSIEKLLPELDEMIKKTIQE